MMDDRSERRLASVHNDLARVVREAHANTQIDGVSFVVIEGLRSSARQAELFRAGATLTMSSRHLTGHAVDLAVTIGGPARAQWKLELYYRLALTMREAAVRLAVPVVWGGCWEQLASIGPTEADIARAVEAYGARCRDAGQKSLVDGPHFELPRVYW